MLETNSFVWKCLEMFGNKSFFVWKMFEHVGKQIEKNKEKQEQTYIILENIYILNLSNKQTPQQNEHSRT